MSKDITPVLDGWDHEADELQVRIVAGIDGREKIQMRLDLGLLQMELEGRPDGLRPGGKESWLEVYEARAAETRALGDSYQLDSDDCAELRREGVQYYHRYLALFHLERYDLVARDTERNLRLFRFVREHATRRADKLSLEQYRPYVTMMRTRALALAAIERDAYATALERIDEGIADIKAFLRDYDQDETSGECQELVFLQQWRREIVGRKPDDPLSRLREQLDRAVTGEDYEEAARIRDQIRRMEIPISEGPLTSRPG